MNDSGSWPQDSMNSSGVVVEMKGSKFRAQSSRSYEQFKVMDDMNDLGTYELSPLDFMN